MRMKIIFCLFILIMFFGEASAADYVAGNCREYNGTYNRNTEQALGYGPVRHWMDFDVISPEQLAEQLATNGLTVTYIEYTGVDDGPNTATQIMNNPSIMYASARRFVDAMRAKNITTFINYINWNFPDMCNDSKFSDKWFTDGMGGLIQALGGTDKVIMQMGLEAAEKSGACWQKAERWNTWMAQNWAGMKSYSPNGEVKTAPSADWFISPSVDPGAPFAVGAIVTTDDPEILDYLASRQNNGWGNVNQARLETYAGGINIPCHSGFIYYDYGYHGKPIDIGAIQALGRVAAKKSSNPCTESNWSSSISPSTCPSSGQQTKTWSKVGTCTGGVTHPATETVTCVYIPPVKLKVMTYNIAGEAFRNSSRVFWVNKDVSAQKIIDLAVDHKVDVVALQALFKGDDAKNGESINLYDLLSTKFAAAGYIYKTTPYWHDITGGQMTQATFSKYPITEQAVLTIPDVCKTSDDTYCKTDVIKSVVNFNDLPLTFFNVHFGPNLNGNCNELNKFITTFLNSYSSVFSFVLGDYNLKYGEGDCSVNLQKTHKDTCAESGDPSCSCSVDLSTRPDLSPPCSRIDQLYYSKNFDPYVDVNSNVINANTVMGTVISDHLPVFAEFTPTGNPNPTDPTPSTPSPPDMLLGAYPIQILSIGSEKYKQIALVDAIISDPASSFQLEKAIFDFRNTQSVSSKIVNTKFSGRKDNYYPKMNIFTNSVSLAYDKPGNPTEVVIQPRVVGSAIESILYSYMWSHIIGQYLAGETCNTPTSLDSPSSSTIYDSEYTAACQEMLAELMARQPTNKPEPDLPPKQTEPAKKWTPSDTVPEEGPKTNITGKEGLAENNSGKVDALYFGSGQLHTGDEFITYPNGLIGSDTGGGCGSLDHQTYYIPAQRPPNWESCIEGETCWTGGQDVTLGNLKVLEVTEDSCTQTNISMNREAQTASLTTIGETVCHGTWPFDYCWDETCTVETQNEMARILNFQQEKKKAWVGEAVAIEPVEGKVYDLGRYEATPVPEWTNETTLYGQGVGAEWDDGAVLMKNLCINPTGFIPPETANVSGEAYEMEPASDPLVEYGSGGMIKYKLDPNSIPLGVKMYLRGGHVYAEYIGAPQINSPNINFTLRKTNLLGYEYAVLSVKDWTGDTKEERGFQVKLIGNPSNCYTSDGIAGFTGKEFAPRILFNWEWANIAENQCDARNEDYTYCDAAQFTINLFKRLEKIQDLLLQKKLVEIPAKTAFYAYLIKDNYSKEFLNDFSEYYTKEAFANTPLSFTVGGYNKIITGNKIDFNVHAPQATTNLPYGGLYRVEIDINFDNENYMSLMDNNNPIAKINISLTPIQPAQNYNAFYETPFDGEVGKKGNTYERKNYGASIKSGEIILNKENVKAMTYSGAMTELKYSLIKDLNELNKGITLRYKNNDQGKELLFYPSQPTPAMMQITGTGSSVRAEYLMQGNGSDSSMVKEWRVKSSTIGGKNCLDFSNGKSLIFKETISGVGRKLLSWPNATKTGVMELVTTFFTPKTQTDITKAAPVDVSIVKLFTSEKYPSLTAGQTIILNYLDVAGVTDYDTLQGMFDRVANSQMCMSKNSSEELLLWWNPDYLEKQIEEIEYDKSHECS